MCTKYPAKGTPTPPRAIFPQLAQYSHNFSGDAHGTVCFVLMDCSSSTDVFGLFGSRTRPKHISAVDSRNQDPVAWDPQRQSNSRPTPGFLLRPVLHMCSNLDPLPLIFAIEQTPAWLLCFSTMCRDRSLDHFGSDRCYRQRQERKPEWRPGKQLQ